MSKLFVCIAAALGMISSAASLSFAADEVKPPKEKIFDFQCRLASLVKFSKGPFECLVSGKVETEEDDLFAQWRAQKKPEVENELRIQCTNGFVLLSDDAAAVIEDGTLWINAEEGEKIATLRVPGFGKEAKTDKAFVLRSDLLFSPLVDRAFRLAGECQFKERKHK